MRNYDTTLAAKNDDLILGVGNLLIEKARDIEGVRHIAENERIVLPFNPVAES